MQSQQFINTLNHNSTLHESCKSKPQTQSINKLYSSQQGSLCSYCHKGKSYSWGLVNQNFDSYTYQVMMERGWRRCGTYYYKIDMQKTCCKTWIHRLDTNNFKIKKDQKKTVKKMMALTYQPVDTNQITNKQQNNLKNPRKASLTPSMKQQKVVKQFKKQPQTIKVTVQICKQSKHLISNICSTINKFLQQEIFTLINKQKLVQINQPFNFNFLQKLRSFASKPTQKTDYYCNYGMLFYGVNKKKFNSKLYPLQQFIKDIKQKVESYVNENATQYFISMDRNGYLFIQLAPKLKQQKSQQFQVIQQISSKSETKLKNKHLSNQLESQKVRSEVQVKFINKPQNVQSVQKMQIQQLTSSRMNKKHSSCKFQKLQPELKGQLIITPDKITFGKLKIILVQAEQNDQSFKLYQIYCKQIPEKQQKGLSSYTSFLCQRALRVQTEQSQPLKDQKHYVPSFDPSSIHQKPHKLQGKTTKRLGCYHMKYFLQNKLIGVGVVDLLPNGLSSVYFFYDPEYKDRRLGVFSSIIQIEYVRYLSLYFPQFKYYYMGFYIHDNKKMDYKGQYGPYQLLCPITYNFVTVDDRVKQIVNNVVRQNIKNIRLAPQGMPKNLDMTFNTDIGVYIDKNIKLTYRKKKLALKDINPQFFIPVLSLLKNYVGVWGKQLFDIFTFTF